MKKKDDITKHDKSHRCVLYDTDDDGKCVAAMKSPEVAGELADEWYKAKDRTWKKIKQEVLQGGSSPIRLYLEYNHMTLKDMAARVGVSVSVLQKHMTMEGFVELDIRMLKKYARVFDIPLCNFFQFIEYSGNITVDVASYHDGVIQDAKFSA